MPRPLRARARFRAGHRRKGLANPLAAILAGKMLLDFLGEKAAAEKMDQAVRKTIASGNVFKPESPDLQVSTSVAGDLVASNL